MAYFTSCPLTRRGRLAYSPLAQRKKTTERRETIAGDAIGGTPLPLGIFIFNGLKIKLVKLWGTLQIGDGLEHVLEASRASIRMWLGKSIEQETKGASRGLCGRN